MIAETVTVASPGGLSVCAKHSCSESHFSYPGAISTRSQRRSASASLTLTPGPSPLPLSAGTSAQVKPGFCSNRITLTRTESETAENGTGTRSPLAPRPLPAPAYNAAGLTP
jgi:hypothetical protein